MSAATCPFCPPAPERVFHATGLVLALWDGFPVSPGHLLVIPRRHVASWFDATREEHAAILEAIEVGKSTVERDRSPDGWNLGVNIGEAAGQTVFHLHVHLIPRYEGDVEDPRGGVRRVVPAKADYWSG